MFVNFNNSLTQAAYELLADKNDGTLYFTTDTKRLYKGNSLYSNNLSLLPVLPANGEENMLYIITDVESINLYIWHEEAFKQVSSIALDSVLVDVEFDDAAQKFTFTYADDTTKEVDLVLESVMQDVSYAAATKILTFTLVNGSKTDISLLDLIDAYDGGDTDTAEITVDENGLIKADIKISSTTGNMLIKDEIGLYVASDLNKMDKISEATDGNIGIFDNNGQMADSGKKITAAIRKDGATDDDIPTELAVRMAIDKAIEDALTWH